MTHIDKLDKDEIIVTLDLTKRQIDLTRNYIEEMYIILRLLENELGMPNMDDGLDDDIEVEVTNIEKMKFSEFVKLAGL